MCQVAVDPAVAHVEVDRMRRPVRDLRAQARVQPQAFTPDDTYYGAYQWHLKAPDGTATANGVANLGGSNVNNAWDLADGNGVVIAVLDTGITAHPDIDTSLRSEEHTSELQSLMRISYAVFCLKKNNTNYT